MMTSPCAFPLLCWLGKGEDLHDLVTLPYGIQVLLSVTSSSPRRLMIFDVWRKQL